MKGGELVVSRKGRVWLDDDYLEGSLETYVLPWWAYFDTITSKKKLLVPAGYGKQHQYNLRQTVQHTWTFDFQILFDFNHNYILFLCPRHSLISLHLFYNFLRWIEFIFLFMFKYFTPCRTGRQWMVYGWNGCIPPFLLSVSFVFSSFVLFCAWFCGNCITLHCICDVVVALGLRYEIFSLFCRGRVCGLVLVGR